MKLGLISQHKQGLRVLYKRLVRGILGGKIEEFVIEIKRCKMRSFIKLY
jgi:hypothetical protein